MTTWASLGLALGASLCFQISFFVSADFWPAGICLFGYLGGLWHLRRQTTARRAFWWGTAVGAAVFVPQTQFLASIFSLPIGSGKISPLAPVLWLLISLWHGVFLLMLRSAERQLGTPWTWVLAPVFWMGQEYFRSEVWWLRFSWLAAGGAIHGPDGWWRTLGVYGVAGMAWMLLGATVLFRTAPARGRPVAGAVLLAALGLLAISGQPPTFHQETTRPILVAGIQLEFPSTAAVLTALNQVLRRQPATELVVLSEYTFDGPPPLAVRRWCLTHKKWLVAGGKEFVRPCAAEASTSACEPPPSDSMVTAFRNTVFVVAPTGEIDFTQAKAQPIQFFADGLRATQQRLWQSPWGAIGIAICYDASYRHVMDELVRQGARALILPTMDLQEWGAHEHALNARQAALRQREYGLPVLRLASSGESILWDAGGRRTATAPFGDTDAGALLAGPLALRDHPAGRPVDAWLAPICAGWTTGWAFWALLQAGSKRLDSFKRHADSPMSPRNPPESRD